MKLARSTVYALIIMIHVAESWEKGCITLKSIAEEENLPVKYIEQIGSTLNKAGLVKSIRGLSGGYRLKRPPENYTVKSVIEVMEGGLTGNSEYEKGISCIADFSREFYRIINDYLGRFTLAELTAKTTADT